MLLNTCVLRGRLSFQGRDPESLSRKGILNKVRQSKTTMRIMLISNFREINNYDNNNMCIMCNNNDGNNTHKYKQ